MSGTNTNTSATGGYIIDRPPFPPNGDAVTRAMQIMVAQLSDLPGILVRPRWQPMPPTQPAVETTWAAVGVIRVEADAYPYIQHHGKTVWPGLPDPGLDQMQRHATVSVMVTYYGPGAEDAAASLRDALFMPQNMEPLVAVGAKLLEVHDMTRVPEIMNQQYIDRVDLRIDLRRQIDRTYPIFDIAAAQVDLHTDTGITDTITVEP
jgi:hypothetical protein